MREFRFGVGGRVGLRRSFRRDGPSARGGAPAPQVRAAVGPGHRRHAAGAGHGIRLWS